MDKDLEKIQQCLKDAKQRNKSSEISPQNTPSNLQNVRLKTNIGNSIHVSFLNGGGVMFVGIALLAILFFYLSNIQKYGYTYLAKNVKLEQSLNTSVQTDAQRVKALVSQVAKCEKRHPNSVHSELRQKYHYKKMDAMTKDQYLMVKNDLKGRQCDLLISLKNNELYNKLN